MAYKSKSLNEILSLHEHEIAQREERELERQRKLAAVIFVLVVGACIVGVFW